MSWDNLWENIFQNHEWGKYPDEHLVRFIARNFYHKQRSKIKILEIGCGPGANVWFLARENFKVDGIDGSPTAIKNANKRLLKEQLRAKLEVGDILNFTYPAKYYDCIVDVECLCSNSLNDTEIILKKINQSLKNGALFYSKTFSSDCFVGPNSHHNKNLEFANITEGPLSGLGLTRLMNRTGIQKLYGKYFKILSIDKLLYTRNNGAIHIGEWIIICRKGG